MHILVSILDGIRTPRGSESWSQDLLALALRPFLPIDQSVLIDTTLSTPREPNLPARLNHDFSLGIEYTEIILWIERYSRTASKNVLTMRMSPLFH